MQKPSLRLSILATLSYSSIFEYPLSSKELWDRIMGFGYSSQEFQKELSHVSQIKKVNNLWVLRGYEEQIDIRKKRQYFSKIKRAEAKTIISLLSKFPTITSGYITGSLAVENVSSLADDIDLLIVTKPGTLWLTRLIIVLWTSILGKYRLHGTRGEWGWCFNLWLDQNHLQMPKEHRSVYSAYEVIQAKQILGTLNELEEHNQWLNEYINYSVNAKRVNHYETRREDGKEIFNFKFLISKIVTLIIWVLEKVSYFLQRVYMQPKRTRERVSTGFAFFHPRETKKLILKKWQERLREAGVGKKEIRELERFFEEGSTTSS